MEIENDKLITPEMASKWLANNGRPNRAIKKSVVKRYAAIMRAKDWRMTAEAIKFDEDGNILDGQHRLRACVEADTSFRALVARGVPSEGDTLKLAGLGGISTNLVASIARTALQLQAGKSNDTTWASENVTSAKLVAFVREFDDDLTAAASLGARAGRVGLNATAVGAVYMTTKERDVFSAFVEDVIEGANLSNGSPALTLRNWVVNNRRNRAGALLHLSAVIRAFNAILDGDELRLIRPYMPGKTFPELSR